MAASVVASATITLTELHDGRRRIVIHHKELKDVTSYLPESQDGREKLSELDAALTSGRSLSRKRPIVASHLKRPAA